MNVLYIFADTIQQRNSMVWRCEFPYVAINATSPETGHYAKLVLVTDIGAGKADDQIAWADVIVVQRNLIREILVMGYTWMRRGKRVILDLDDGYQYIPHTIWTAAYWKDGQEVVEEEVKQEDNGKAWTRPDVSTKISKKKMLGYDPITELNFGIKLASAVSAPSEVICADHAPLARKTLFVPNYPIVKPYVDALKNKKPSDKIRIGWAGGSSHTQSFEESGALVALGRVVERHKDTEAIIAGPEDIFAKLKTTRKTLYKWTAYENYPANLAQIDIGIAPLVGAYDLRRSWIKALEYSLMGIPWIATGYKDKPFQPYGMFSSHLIYNQTASRWEERLEDLLFHYEDFKTACVDEWRWAVKQDISLHIADILKQYQELEA